MPHELAALFAAGVLTFLSPCVLPLVPVYLGLLAGTTLTEVQAGRGGSRVVVAASLFALGLTSVFVALGLAATSLARVLDGHRDLLLGAGGAVVILAGLRFLGLLRLPWLERERRPFLARLRGGQSLAAAFFFGAAFALGWTPCIGPVLGSALAYTASATANPGRGALDLAAYALGLSLPLISVAAAAPLALPLLARIRRHLGTLERVTGAVLVLTGLWLATGQQGLPDRAAPPTPASQACESQSATCDYPGGDRGQDPRDVVVTDSGDAVAATARAADRPTLLVFSTPECPVCRRMKPVLARLGQLCTGAAIVRQVDLADATGRALARKHHVLGVPTFVYLDRAGIEIARLAGEQTLPTLTAPLAAETGERCSL